MNNRSPNFMQRNQSGRSNLGKEAKGDLASETEFTLFSKAEAQLP